MRACVSINVTGLRIMANVSQTARQERWACEVQRRARLDPPPDIANDALQCAREDRMPRDAGQDLHLCLRRAVGGVGTIDAERERLTETDRVIDGLNQNQVAVDVNPAQRVQGTVSKHVSFVSPSEEAIVRRERLAAARLADELARTFVVKVGEREIAVVALQPLELPRNLPPGHEDTPWNNCAVARQFRKIIQGMIKSRATLPIPVPELPARLTERISFVGARIVEQVGFTGTVAPEVACFGARVVPSSAVPTPSPGSGECEIERALLEPQRIGDGSGVYAAFAGWTDTPRLGDAVVFAVLIIPNAPPLIGAGLEYVLKIRTVGSPQRRRLNARASEQAFREVAAWR